MASAKDLAKSLGGFFTVADITEYGADGVNLTIALSAVEQVGQGRDAEDKPVLGFKEVNKKMVLAKGRCASLADLFGNDDLNGKQINAYIQIEKGRAQIGIREPQ
jgi:hypothetical protein